jgi:hypothetical protein
MPSLSLTLALLGVRDDNLGTGQPGVVSGHERSPLLGLHADVVTQRFQTGEDRETMDRANKIVTEEDEKAMDKIYKVEGCERKRAA